MGLLAGGITPGQTVALVLLCIFLSIFVIFDVYLVLFLRRKNKKLAKNADTDDKNKDDGTSDTIN